MLRNYKSPEKKEIPVCLLKVIIAVEQAPGQNENRGLKTLQPGKTNRTLAEVQKCDRVETNAAISQ